MKKFLIALLAILMLTACGKQDEPAAAPPMPEEVVQTPVEEAPVVEPEQEPIEMPVQVEEPQEPSPEEIPEDDSALIHEIIHVEDLIEDTVAYNLEQPVFSDFAGAEQVNTFYEVLVQQLAEHTKENVYPAVMEQHTMANVCGVVEYLHWDADQVQVTYQYQVEYLNDTPADTFSRTDCFDLKTGEIIPAEPQ